MRRALKPHLRRHGVRVVWQRVWRALLDVDGDGAAACIRQLTTMPQCRFSHVAWWRLVRSAEQRGARTSPTREREKHGAGTVRRGAETCGTWCSRWTAATRHVRGRGLTTDSL